MKCSINSQLQLFLIRPKVRSLMASRTGKQCKERYFNHLDPNKIAWTLSESNVIRDMFPEFGTDWTLYMTFLPGRSNKAIRSHYHAISPNNFQHCVLESSNNHSVASHKRGVERCTDPEDDEPSRKHLRKLIADRAAMDREILELEKLCALDNDHALLMSGFSLLSTSCPSSLSDSDNFVEEFRVDTL